MSSDMKQLTQEEISAFCQQINMIIKSGLPTYYGISILRDECTDSDTKALLTAIYNPMEQGASLYDAISSTGVFPKYMLQMVHIGEQTGRLEEVLDSLTIYYEREADIRESIRHAVTYPIIMTVMMFAVILVMITKVVPIFSDVYAELGSDLTGSAALLMHISNFLNQHLFSLVIAFVFLVILLVFFLHTPLGKQFYEKKGIAYTLAASRVANCMYLTLASGMDTNQGLTLAESLVDNNYMKTCILACKDLMTNGESFAKSLVQSGIFSQMYSGIIAIRYKTGAMDDVMLQISKAYEKETDEKIQQFVSLLEPILLIILSFFIGLILLSFLLPLLGIMSSIG